MENKKEIILEQSESENNLLLSDFEGDILEKVKKYSDEIIGTNQSLLLIFKSEYLTEINFIIEEFYNLNNKSKSINYISSIEGTIGTFIGKELNLGYFVFGPKIFKKLKYILLEGNIKDFRNYFNEIFLVEFEKIILNQGKQNLPNIIGKGESIGINPTVVCFENNGKINFKLEYFDSEEVRKKSFEDSEINLAIEEKDEDINEKGHLKGIKLNILSTSKVLALEDKIGIYVNSFSNIIDILFKNKNDNIGIILNNNKLLEKQEDLYYFLEQNKAQFLKHKNGEKIYNFIIDISENMLEMNFKEYLEKSNISYIEFLDYGNIFSKIISKL